MLGEPCFSQEGVNVLKERVHDAGHDTRFSVRRNTRNNVLSARGCVCYNVAMNEEWFQRVKEMIEADPRSYRKLSEDAGCGQNFVQQFVNGGKDPRSSQFSKLLTALGPGAAVYVISGLKMSQQDLEFLRVVSSLPPDAQSEALAVLRRMAGTQSQQEPSPSDLETTSSTLEATR